MRTTTCNSLQQESPAQIPLINDHADMRSKARGLKFGPSFICAHLLEPSLLTGAISNQIVCT